MQRSATVLDMVIAGVGIAVLPHSVTHNITSSALISRPLIEPEVIRTLGVVRNTTKTLSATAKVLLDIVRKHSHQANAIRSMRGQKKTGMATDQWMKVLRAPD